MVILFRVILFFALIYLVYKAIKMIIDPKRKLELAREQKKFYFLDDQENVRKNFFITYKGVVFQGEKYLGTTESAFEVISIFIWTNSTSALKGFSIEDFQYLEKEVKERYPNSKIDWKSPIKELLKKKSSDQEE